MLTFDLIREKITGRQLTKISLSGKKELNGDDSTIKE